MSLELAWATAKQRYANQSGKEKKPAEKMSLAWEKKSKLGVALKDYDGAKNSAAREKAMQKLSSGVNLHVKLLTKSLTENASSLKTAKGPDKNRCKKEAKALQTLRTEAQHLLDLAKKTGPKPEACKVGPLKFNLLAEVKAKNLALPKRFDVIVDVDVVFSGDDTVLATQIQQAASNHMDGIRANVRKAIAGFDKRIGTESDPARRQKLVKELNDYLESTGQKGAAAAEKEIKKEAMTLYNRGIDATVHKCKVGTKVVFKSINLVDNVMDLGKSSGVGTVFGILKILKGLYDLIKLVVGELKALDKTQQEFEKTLKKLTKIRDAHLQKDKGVAATATSWFRQFWETVTDQIGGAEDLLETLSSKATDLDKASKKMGASLTKLLDAQESIEDRATRKILEPRTKDIIKGIIDIQKQFKEIRKLEPQYSAKLKELRNDQPVAVKIGKTGLQIYSLLNPMNALQKGTEKFITIVGQAAKKK